MRRTLDVNSETAAKLQSIAQAKNISVDDLLSGYLADLAISAEPVGPSSDAIAALEDWISSIPDTLPLSDEAITRSSIYEGR